MPMLINSPSFEKRLLARRRETGADRFDEVWNGVYVMAPLANNQHQFLATRYGVVVSDSRGTDTSTIVLVGANISDRVRGWKKNFRCPDVAVFLPGNPAQDCGTHWCGGPDWALEITSPKERVRQKLKFYAKVGMKELLILDRNPWRLQLYRLQNGKLQSVSKIVPDDQQEIVCNTIGLHFALKSGSERPVVEVEQPSTGKRWTI
jgi:Uma2 family endonuclease